MHRLILLALAIGASGPALPADTFDEIRERRLAECASIPGDEYSTGLLFNPAGYKTFFHRSECIQRLAIDERDVSLCERVRERKSWFFDGSAISPEACRNAVFLKLDEEQQELAAFLRSQPYRIESVFIRRNGNGKDYDVLLDTAGGYTARYTFSLATRDGALPAAVLERTGYHSSATGTLRLLLRAADLEKTLGAGWRTREWEMVASVTLTRDSDNRFWYDHLAPGDRTHTIELAVVFERLPPWTPENHGRKTGLESSYD